MVRFWNYGRSLAILLLVGMGLSACDLQASTAPETQIPETPTAFTPAPVDTETPTPLPGVVLLHTPEGAPGWVEDEFLPTLTELVSDAGLALETEPLDPSDARAVQLEIVLAEPSGSVGGFEPAGQQGLLLVGGGEGRHTEASAIGGGGWRYDRQGFIAGYVAAMITEDWRVAVVADSRLPGGEAAMTGFENGVYFFCGLCRQIYPPFIEAPIQVDLADHGSLDAALAPLAAARIETTYIAPGAASDDLLRRLQAVQIQVIGVQRPVELPELAWVASIRPAPGQALREAWTSLLAGERVVVPMPLQIVEVDEARLSPGRLRMAQETLQTLLAGLIDTGVDGER